MNRILMILGFVLHLVLIGVFFCGGLWVSVGRQANGYIGALLIILSGALIYNLPMWRDLWADIRSSTIRR